MDRSTVSVLRNLTTAPSRDADVFVFTTRTGSRMSRDAVAARLTLHAKTAAAACPSLSSKMSARTS